VTFAINGFDLATIKSILMHAVVGLPPEAWWLAGLVILVLAAAAAIDGFSGSVPDPLIFLGLLAVTATQGIYVSWPFAAAHLTWAIGAGIAIWAVNEIWYRFFRTDAIGMGDAKWTMLAVAAFDVIPALFAWGMGAVLAVAWMGALRLARYQLTRIYFAPFLFLGLMTGIYWVRLR
jgi:hypothetical protein